MERLSTGILSSHVCSGGDIVCSFCNKEVLPVATQNLWPNKGKPLIICAKCSGQAVDLTSN